MALSGYNDGGTFTLNQTCRGLLTFIFVSKEKSQLTWAKEFVSLSLKKNKANEIYYVRGETALFSCAAFDIFGVVPRVKKRVTF